MIGMEFYCQKGKQVRQILLRKFLENKLSAGYVNGTSYVQKVIQET